MMSTANFTGQVLAPDEWGRIAHVFEQSDEPRPVPELTKILTVEREGEIIATFSSQWMLYLSHMWVRADSRGGYLAERLALKTIEAYPKGTKAFMHTANAHIEKLAYRIGMMPVKGSGWLWRGDNV